MIDSILLAEERDGERRYLFCWASCFRFKH